MTAAVDLGGTNVRAAIVDDGGNVLAHDRIPTPSSDADTEFLPALLRRVCSKIDARPARAVIGVPGIVDHRAEMLLSAPNLPQQWIPELNEKRLEQELNCPVSLANDADLACVGEASFGAGRSYRDVVYVTISTGVGAGIVVDGKLVKGGHSGGEIGHTMVDAGAARRGEPATVEQIGSGTAIASAVSAAGLDVGGAELVDLVRTGDERACDIWHTAMAAVGIGLTNVAWLIPTQIIVLGGGVGLNHDVVAPIISEQLRTFGPRGASDIVLAAAELGDDAALVGAAAWWEAVGRPTDAPVRN